MLRWGDLLVVPLDRCFELGRQCQCSKNCLFFGGIMILFRSITDSRNLPETWTSKCKKCHLNKKPCTGWESLTTSFAAAAAVSKANASNQNNRQRPSLHHHRSLSVFDPSMQRRRLMSLRSFPKCSQNIVRYGIILERLVSLHNSNPCHQEILFALSQCTDLALSSFST